MIIPLSAKLLFIGDSITCADRDPMGEAAQDGLGVGYVNLVNSILQTNEPKSKIRILNRGVNGNTVKDLEKRWGEDVLEIRPNWLSVMIGINDVWRQFDSSLRTETHVLPEEYESTLDTLLVNTRSTLAGLVLMTPYVIEPCLDDPMRQRMDKYGAIVKALAKRHDALFVDTQAAMDALTEHIHPTAIAQDRIHPSTLGHMALAKAFLRAIEFEWKSDHV